MAAMKPAFVIAAAGDDASIDELAEKHILSLIGGVDTEFPRSYYLRWAPYVFGLGADGTWVADTTAQSYCKRLGNQPPSFGGSDVQTVPFPKDRHVGIVHPETNGDPAAQLSAQGGPRPGAHVR
jgi:hypothetical protein